MDELVLVTGACGQLGVDVVNELKRRCISYIATNSDTLDITQIMQMRDFFSHNNNITTVINCAAYTAVDKAEEEITKCFAVNETGSENLAKICGENGIKLIYISTDYVFSGEGNVPFEVDSPKMPLNVYGKSKLAGEEAVKRYCPKHFIVRTSWVFGENGCNFVKTMLRLAGENEQVGVVCDQIGSPTYTVDLAALLCDMVMSEKYGEYHATNSGFCSWCDFAAAIFEKSELNCTVKSLDSAEYKKPAKRPLNSRMSKQSLLDAGFSLLPDWQDALDRYLVKIRETCIN